MKNGPDWVVSTSGTRLGMSMHASDVILCRDRSRSFDLILFSINFNFKAPIFFAPKSRNEARRARAAGKMPLPNCDTDICATADDVDGGGDCD